MLKISRSGYYAWNGRTMSRHEQKNILLKEEIKRVFFENKKRYGSPRVHKQLKTEKIVCGRHRVARLMREEDLVARRKRKYRKVWSERDYRANAMNVLNRQFDVKEPNKVWATDVSYFWTRSGWIHLAIVMDLYSRRIIGWSMNKRVDQVLTQDALRMALNQREPRQGLIHHSDQGAEYTNHSYQNLVKEHNMVVSMSRRGECHDNAVAESFLNQSKLSWLNKKNSKLPKKRDQPFLNILKSFTIERGSIQLWVIYLRLNMSELTMSINCPFYRGKSSVP